MRSAITENFTAYSTIKEQENIERNILNEKYAFEERPTKKSKYSLFELEEKLIKKSRLSFLSTLSELLVSIIQDNGFPALAELYTRYRNDPSKTEALAELDEILLDPGLILFWGNILGRKANLRAFSPCYSLRRHRLKNQSFNKPDDIHVFHLLIANFYGRSLLSRHYVFIGFSNFIEKTCSQEFSQAIKIFKYYWEQFTPRTPVDLKCSTIINEQIKQLDNFDYFDVFSTIQEQIEHLRKEQEREIEWGMQYHSPYAYRLSIEHTAEILRVALQTREIVHPKYLEMLYKMEERLKPIEKIYGAAGFYMMAIAHYEIGKSLQAMAEQLREALPQKILAPKYQVCARQIQKPPSPTEIQIQLLANNYENIAKCYYENAVAKIDVAIFLNETGEYHDLLFNICRGNKDLNKVMQTAKENIQEPDVTRENTELKRQNNEDSEDTKFNILKDHKNSLLKDIISCYPDLPLEKIAQMTRQMLAGFNHGLPETQSLTVTRPIHYSQQETPYFNTLITKISTKTIRREWDELNIRYKELIKNKPRTFFTNSHDSFPDEEQATQYYQKLAEFIFQLKKVRQWQNMKHTGSNAFPNEMQQFIKNEFLFAAQDIAHVANTASLSMACITKTNGEFSSEELSKQFNDARYIYDRLFFLIPVLEDQDLANLIPSEIKQRVFELRDLLSQHFSSLLSNPPPIRQGLLLKKQVPNPYWQVIYKRVATETSPVPLSLGTRLDLPPECMKIIFSFLNPLQLLTTSAVCKQFWRFATDESFWKHWYGILTLLLDHIPKQFIISAFIKECIREHVGPIEHPSFENAAKTFPRRKKLVVKNFCEITERLEKLNDKKFELMFFQRPTDPIAILTRSLNTFYKEYFSKNDLIFLTNELCDLLLFDPNRLPKFFMYEGKQLNTWVTMLEIAKCLTDPQLAECYTPPKEIYHFCCRHSADHSTNVESSHPWLFQPLRRVFGSALLTSNLCSSTASTEKEQTTQLSA